MKYDIKYNTLFLLEHSFQIILFLIKTHQIQMIRFIKELYSM